jgi:hypothetical protein
VHRKLGNRSRAVFMLERAAAANKPGTPLRQRAELEIQRIEFPVFPESGLDRAAPDGGDTPRYRTGEIVTWAGQLGRRYVAQRPEVSIEWIAPGGAVARRERLHAGGGGLSSRLQTGAATPPGRWTVRIELAGNEVEERSFELAPRP